MLHNIFLFPNCILTFLSFFLSFLSWDCPKVNAVKSAYLQIHAQAIFALGYITNCYCCPHEKEITGSCLLLQRGCRVSYNRYTTITRRIPSDTRSLPACRRDMSFLIAKVVNLSSLWQQTVISTTSHCYILKNRLSSFCVKYCHLCDNRWSLSYVSTMVQNCHESRRKYWATRLSIRLHRSLICLLRTARFSCGKVSD